jgi:hypothetical protein
MVDAYRTEPGQYSGTGQVVQEVHRWRPPCSCGVELSEAVAVSESPKTTKVHRWRPPCSCGVSLDDYS